MNRFYLKYYKNILSKNKLEYTGYFFGQFYSGAMTAPRILSFLDYLHDIAPRHGEITAEIMTHPGMSEHEYENIEFCDDDFKKYRWRDEYLTFTSGEVMDRLKKYNIELINYRKL